MTPAERDRRAKDADDEMCVMLLAVLARIRLHNNGRLRLDVERSHVDCVLAEAGL